MRQQLDDEDDEEVRAALGERKDGTLSVLARDEIHLPVAKSLAVCLGRAVLYAHPIGDAADSPYGTLPVLEPVAAVLVEVATRLLVPADCPVYRFVRYPHAF